MILKHDSWGTLQRVFAPDTSSAARAVVTTALRMDYNAKEAAHHAEPRNGAITMGGLLRPEFLIIVVVALLIFGPKKLPEMGSSIGKTIREFQKSMREVKEQQEQPGAAVPPAAPVPAAQIAAPAAAVVAETPTGAIPAPAAAPPNPAPAPAPAPVAPAVTTPAADPLPPVGTTVE